MPGFAWSPHPPPSPRKPPRGLNVNRRSLDEAQAGAQDGCGERAELLRHGCRMKPEGASRLVHLHHPLPSITLVANDLTRPRCHPPAPPPARPTPRRVRPFSLLNLSRAPPFSQPPVLQTPSLCPLRLTAASLSLSPVRPPLPPRNRCHLFEKQIRPCIRSLLSLTSFNSSLPPSDSSPDSSARFRGTRMA